MMRAWSVSEASRIESKLALVCSLIDAMLMADTAKLGAVMDDLAIGVIAVVVVVF